MPVAVELYADVLCPFAWALLGQLVVERAEVGAADVPILVRAWPFERVDHALPSPERLAGDVAALRATVAPGRFEGFDASRVPESTIPAMALTSACYGKANEVGEAVAVRLRELVFEEGSDVGDPGVLGALYAATGFHVPADPGLVDAEYELAVHRGVTGSPFLVAGDIHELCPTFSVERDVAGRAVVTPTPWAADVLRSCFVDP